MSKSTEAIPKEPRRGCGQYYTADGTAYLLYDSPDEWGLRIGLDADVTLGESAAIEGDHPFYTVLLPSGMSASIGPKSAIRVDPGDWFSLADALREALA